VSDTDLLFRAALDTDAGVMVDRWRIRVRSWTFTIVRRLADLPF
jgi:hypothetical protein